MMTTNHSDELVKLAITQIGFDKIGASAQITQDHYTGGHVLLLRFELRDLARDPVAAIKRLFTAITEGPLVAGKLADVQKDLEAAKEIVERLERIEGWLVAIGPAVLPTPAPGKAGA